MKKIKQIKFFEECILPKATAQQRRHDKKGRTYLPVNVKKAKATLKAILEKHAPSKPFTGPIKVIAYMTWQYPKSRKKEETQYKITKPDLDNFEKLLFDTMTECGYWIDDVQIALKTTGKFESMISGISITVETLQNIV